MNTLVSLVFFSVINFCLAVIYFPQVFLTAMVSLSSGEADPYLLNVAFGGYASPYSYPGLGYASPSAYGYAAPAAPIAPVAPAVASVGQVCA